jgi:hypothetical protein
MKIDFLYQIEAGSLCDYYCISGINIEYKRFVIANATQKECYNRPEKDKQQIVYIMPCLGICFEYFFKNVC